MEPNKVENQIREKLNAREIQPSSQAWDRLDAMLTVAEEKKRKRPFLWLYIAASILGFATLGLFLFSQKNSLIHIQNNVVNTEIKKDTVQNPTNNIQTEATIRTQQNQVVVITNNKPTTNNEQPATNNQGVSINNQKTANNQQLPNSSINHDKPTEYLLNSDVAVKEIPKIETEKEINSSDTKKLDDFLLANLDNAAKQSVNKKSVVKVDAKSLLYQVDGELELTFREKVINKASKNYKEIKVALANRNNE